MIGVGSRVIDASGLSFRTPKEGIIVAPADGRGRFGVVWFPNAKIFVGGTETLAIAPVEWWLPEDLEERHG